VDRDPKLGRQLEKFGKIAEIVRDVCGNQGKQEALSFLGLLGVSHQLTQQIGAVHLSETQRLDLVARLIKSRLINQAEQSGLLWEPGEGRFAEARFTDGIILLPELGDDGRCFGFSILPTVAGSDTTTISSDPENRLRP
jgi:hypothetical protein